MSNDAEAYVQAVSEITTDTYCTFAAFALLAFEWIITFDREVRLVWRRKITGASVLFILNRYSLFFQFFAQIVSTYPLSQRSCEVDGYMVIIGQGAPYFIWASFSVLRAYALSNRKWWIIPLVFIFYIPDLVINCYYFTFLTPQVLPPPFNCVLSSTLAETLWVHLTIADRVCLIMGDAIVLYITWYSTFGIRKAMAGVNVRTSLTDALLENGTLYFVCLLILNIVNILANAIPKTSAVSEFQDPITSILVSRFLLNLRDTAGCGSVSDSTVDSTAPSFVARSRGHSTTLADFIDSMGAGLDHSVDFRRYRSDSLDGWDDNFSDETWHELGGRSVATMQTCATTRVASPEGAEEVQVAIASVDDPVSSARVSSYLSDDQNFRRNSHHHAV